MSTSIWNKTRHAFPAGFSRRDLFRKTSLITAGGLLPGGLSLLAAAAPGLSFGADMYQSLGVRPLINCKGVFTSLSGSLMLPEVRQAMAQASMNFVHIDELMEAVGKRLAEITGAEWGMVSSSATAALTHATSACITGGDPEKIRRLPDLAGLKNEVIVPSYSRNVYDHAVRMLGVNMINVENEQELRSALSSRTAMVMVMAKKRSTEDRGPFGLPVIAKIAHQHGVPVLVDAAADNLTIPNAQLGRGADLVAYSGGKALRGPQSTGLLLGRKDLVKAAWANSAPHHSFGRPMKIGKEDIMGLLAAVEMWVRRDHEAEFNTWIGWLNEMARSVKRVPGVTTELRKPIGMSNHSPLLVVQWDSRKLGITGEEVYRHLYNADPRIVLASGTGNRRSGGASYLTVLPWQMQAGSLPVVVDALYRVLSDPPKIESRPKVGGPAANVEGRWKLRMEFVAGSAEHVLFVDQDGEEIVGRHEGEITAGDLTGWVDGAEVHFRSSHPYEGSSFSFDFRGKLEGDTMQGVADLGEYGSADWSAKRYEYSKTPRRVGPVVKGWVPL